MDGDQDLSFYLRKPLEVLHELISDTRAAGKQYFAYHEYNNEHGEREFYHMCRVGVRAIQRLDSITLQNIRYISWETQTGIVNATLFYIGSYKFILVQIDSYQFTVNVDS